MEYPVLTQCASVWDNTTLRHSTPFVRFPLFCSGPSRPLFIAAPALTLSFTSRSPVRHALQTAMAQELGNGWVAAMDPGSGRTYYANTLTGVTCWEYPAEL